MGWQKFRELVLTVDIRHFRVWSYLQSVKHWRHYTFTLVDKNDLITCWKWGLKLSGGAVCGDWHDICFGSLSTRPKLSEHLWIILMASQLWRLLNFGGENEDWSYVQWEGAVWAVDGHCCDQEGSAAIPTPSPSLLLLFALCSSNTFKILFYIFLFLLIKIGLYLSTHIRYLDYLDPGSPIHKLLHCFHHY